MKFFLLGGSFQLVVAQSAGNDSESRLLLSREARAQEELEARLARAQEELEAREARAQEELQAREAREQEELQAREARAQEEIQAREARAIDECMTRERYEIDECGTRESFAIVECEERAKTKREACVIEANKIGERFWEQSLRYAVQDENTSKVNDLLVAPRGDIDAPNANGDNALMLAATTGNEPIAKKLLDAGADMDTRNPQTQSTPLIEAASNGYIDIAVLLVRRHVSFRTAQERAWLDVIRNDGNTALSIAVKRHHWMVVCLLVNVWADLMIMVPTSTGLLKTERLLVREIEAAFKAKTIEQWLKDGIMSDVSWQMFQKYIQGTNDAIRK